VVGGTLSALLQRLFADENSVEEGFELDGYIDAFLITHGMFISSIDLLKAIMDRYNQPPEKGKDGDLVKLPKRKSTDQENLNSNSVQVRIIQVVHRWAQQFPEEFTFNTALFALFAQWTQQLKEEHSKKKLKKEKKKSKFMKLATAETLVGDAARMRMLLNRPFEEEEDGEEENDEEMTEEDIINAIAKDTSAKELAQQLTFADHTIFKKIRFEEFFHTNWTKHKEKAPNVTTMIQWFNEVSLWIMSQLVLSKDVKERAKLLSKFISVGQEMRNLNNFNGTMLVLSALNNSSIRRLTDTWEKISPKKIKDLDTLQELLNPDDSFANLKTALKNCVECPTIPFMGVYLTQITYIEENPDTRDGLINFNKLTMLAKILSELRIFQQMDYNIKPIEKIVGFFLPEALNPLAGGKKKKGKRRREYYGKRMRLTADEIYSKSLEIQSRK